MYTNPKNKSKSTPSRNSIISLLKFPNLFKSNDKVKPLKTNVSKDIDSNKIDTYSLSEEQRKKLKNPRQTKEPNVIKIQGGRIKDEKLTSNSGPLITRTNINEIPVRTYKTLSNDIDDFISNVNEVKSIKNSRVSATRSSFSNGLNHHILSSNSNFDSATCSKSPSSKFSSNKYPSPLTPPISVSQQFSQLSSSPTTTPPPTKTKKELCCDKCDGKHETDNCPYFKKPRENHPDAQKLNPKQMGGTSNLPGAFISSSSARVIRQPGDGSCLFHSMSYGLGQGYNASRLRSEICTFIANNPNLSISETPLKDWIKWDSGTSVVDYSRKMRGGSWGGGIEMACVSQMKQVNVHVYERSGSGFKRISAFDFPVNNESRPVIRVLYCGGVHYGKHFHQFPTNLFLLLLFLSIRCVSTLLENILFLF